MPIEINVSRIKTKVSPREGLGKNLPITGGWGYSKEDAVVINKNDSIVEDEIEFDGVAIEYVFVEKRVYLELIVSKKRGHQFSGIEWKLLEQRLHMDEYGIFDVLTFDVTAIPDADWEVLKAEWESYNGFEDSPIEREAHIKRSNAKTVHYQAEYWFEISSFFGGWPTV
jgi:hypothetical protein